MELSKRATRLRRVIEWLERSREVEINHRDLEALFPDDLEGATCRRVTHELVRLGVLQRRAPGVFL